MCAKAVVQTGETQDLAEAVGSLTPQLKLEIAVRVLRNAVVRTLTAEVVKEPLVAARAAEERRAAEMHSGAANGKAAERISAAAETRAAVLVVASNGITAEHQHRAVEAVAHRVVGPLALQLSVMNALTVADRRRHRAGIQHHSTATDAAGVTIAVTEFSRGCVV